MAGKGTEIGRTFEELSEIIEKCSENDRLSVTFDTCHANDAGYDVKASGITIDRFCGSGISAVSLAAACIKSGKVVKAVR